MNAELKRLEGMAAGWEGSDAVVTLSVNDAVLLLPHAKGESAKTMKGDRPTAVGKELADMVKAAIAAEPEPEEETPEAKPAAKSAHGHAGKAPPPPPKS